MSHPTVAGAPLPRVTLFSPVAVVYVYQGTFTGTFRYEGLKLRFNTSGPLSASGPPFWVFPTKGPEYYPLLTGNTDSDLEKSGVKYKNGSARFASYDDADAINVTFKGEEARDNTFTMKGDVDGGRGLFLKAKGKFSASGSLNRFASTFTITFKIEVTKV